MTYINQEGHLTEEGIALYVDGLKLDRVHQVPEPILEHLDTCGICEAEVLELYTIVSQMDQSEQGVHPSLEPKTKPAGKVRSMLLRLAVAAVLAALAFTIYQNLYKEGAKIPAIVNEDKETPKIPEELRPQQPTPPQEKLLPAPKKNEDIAETPPTEPKEVVKEKERIVTNRDLYAANFEPYPDWEEDLNDVYRSESVKVLSPQKEASFYPKTAINFDWESDLKVEWTISIFNNKGDIVFWKPTDESELKKTLSFDPGLYYWKLESPDDIWHLGKFTIE